MPNFKVFQNGFNIMYQGDHSFFLVQHFIGFRLRFLNGCWMKNTLTLEIALLTPTSDGFSSSSEVGNLPTSQACEMRCSFLSSCLQLPSGGSTFTAANPLPVTPIGDLLNLNWFPKRLSPERLMTTSIKRSHVLQFFCAD